MFIACCFKTFQDKTFSLWEFVPLASPCFACRLARWLRVGQKIWLLKGSATALGVSGKENYGKLKLMPFDKASGVWHMDRSFLRHCWLCCDDWSKVGIGKVIKGWDESLLSMKASNPLCPSKSQYYKILQLPTHAEPQFLSYDSYACQAYFYHRTVPYHEDARSVKDARSSSLQILATGTVASGLSRLVQRFPALILHEGTFFLQWP